jgi:hypothetical protein
VHLRWHEALIAGAAHGPTDWMRLLLSLPCSTLSTNKLTGSLPKEWAALTRMWDL